ncbi:MAG: hypothetical protein ACD_10C00477G0002 [uncultured bacterium]|nr:MAG: hypothetical protein ACD_10C00477G0002 [uncultured bacterium]
MLDAESLCSLEPDATCSDAAASCSEELESRSASCLSLETISRNSFCIFDSAASKLSLLADLSCSGCERSPVAIRWTASLASLGSPPSGPTTERIVHIASMIESSSEPSKTLPRTRWARSATSFASWAEASNSSP